MSVSIDKLNKRVYTFRWKVGIAGLSLLPRWPENSREKQLFNKIRAGHRSPFYSVLFVVPNSSRRKADGRKQEVRISEVQCKRKSIVRQQACRAASASTERENCHGRGLAEWEWELRRDSLYRGRNSQRSKWSSVERAASHKRSGPVLLYLFFCEIPHELKKPAKGSRDFTMSNDGTRNLTL